MTIGTQMQPPSHAGTPPVLMMAGGSDVTCGLLGRCTAAAEAIRRGEYRLVRLQIEGQQRSDRWLLPLAECRFTLPEIRIVDDPVPIREKDDDGVMELVARALSGRMMTNDEGSLAVSALKAIVAAEGVLERCPPTERRIVRAAMATPWGPAMTGEIRRTTTGPSAGTPATGLAWGTGQRFEASLLPTCTCIGYRDEPGHRGHIRIEPVSIMCTEKNAPDAVETLRILADLADRPFT